MSDELRECRSCGGNAYLAFNGLYSRPHKAKCSICGMATAASETKELATERWNRQPVEDDLRRRVGELEKGYLGLVLWAADYEPSPENSPCDVCGSEEQTYGREWQTFDQGTLGCTGTDCEWFCEKHLMEKVAADVEHHMNLISDKGADDG